MGEPRFDIAAIGQKQAFAAAVEPRIECRKIAAVARERSGRKAVLQPQTVTERIDQRGAGGCFLHRAAIVMRRTDSLRAPAASA